MRTMSVALAAALTMALAAGCGGGDTAGRNGAGAREDPSPVTTVSQPAGQPSSTSDDKPEEEFDPVAAYVAGLASTNASTARDGLQHAAPDSTAHAYLQHRINLIEAALDGGQHYEDHTVDRIDGGYELCDPLDRTECTDVTGFETADGLITDMLFDEESPGPRLIMGDGNTVEDSGVTVEFLSAYRSITSDALFVTIRVSTGDEAAEMQWLSATYRAPDGGQRQTGGVDGPLGVGADSTATVALVFPGVELGGAVTVDGFLDDFATSIELTVEVS